LGSSRVCTSLRWLKGPGARCSVTRHLVARLRLKPHTSEISIRTPTDLIIRPLARTRTSVPAAAIGDALARLRAAEPAVATWSLAGILLAVWLIELTFMGQVHGGRRIGYLAFGALPNVTVPGRGSPGDLWRYLTTELLHQNRMHFVINAAALLIVGRRAERLHGRLVVLATFAISAAAAGLAWMTASSLGLSALDQYSIGASGGICGLAGLLLLHGRFGRTGTDARILRAGRRTAAVAVGVLVLPGIVITGTNNWAHAGGLACGGILGLRLPALVRHGGRPLSRMGRGVLLVAVVLALVALAIGALHLGQRLLGGA
jgi:membrane associated rhomboid family serine protease